MDLRQILLPTDFSETSDHAERFARRLAARFGSNLTIVHVKDVRQPEITRTDVVVLDGDPSGEIVREAREREADLIVMATHGYGRFRRFILGSVTAKVLHDADCPVLTATHLCETAELGEAPFGHILCAVDLGPASADVIRAAAWAAERDGAKLSLVHMLPPQSLLGFSYYDSDRWTTHAGAMFERLQTETGVLAPWYVREGELAPGINALGAEIGAGLLVIGRHPSKGLAGRLHDAAYALIRESRLPVLSI